MGLQAWAEEGHQRCAPAVALHGCSPATIRWARLEQLAVEVFTTSGGFRGHTVQPSRCARVGHVIADDAQFVQEQVGLGAEDLQNGIKRRIRANCDGSSWATRGSGALRASITRCSDKDTPVLLVAGIRPGLISHWPGIEP
jgi:hypothetical protein